MGHITIIAELGSSPAPAWDFEPWCAAAAKAGADAVKVQLFRVDHFPESERAAKRPLEFPRGRLREYVQCAHAYGLTAGASVFDLDAVALAAEWCDWLKLAAREQDNKELFTFTWNNWGRIYHEDTKQVTCQPWYRSVSDKRKAGHMMLGINLFAIPTYPASLPLSLLRLVEWAYYCRQRPHELPRFGWSSHTTGYVDCVLAARLGASVIEKHLAIDPHDLEAGHSLSPSQFAAMCRAIRKGESHASS